MIFGHFITRSQRGQAKIQQNSNSSDFSFIFATQPILPDFQSKRFKSSGPALHSCIHPSKLGAHRTPKKSLPIPTNLSILFPLRRRGKAGVTA
jgi:hypothetical protein